MQVLISYQLNTLLSFCLLVVNSFALFAQRDFVVLHSGDTMNAKRISFNLNKTRFKTLGGRVTVQSIDVKEYYRKGVKYLIVRSPFTNNLVNYVVIAEGRATLLMDWGAELPINECLLMLIDNETYFVSMGHFSDEIWSKLITCPAFYTKFNIYAEDNNKKIIGLSKRRSRDWREMLSYYNKNCT